MPSMIGANLEVFLTRAIGLRMSRLGSADRKFFELDMVIRKVPESD